jgi:hypothetical protein
MVYFGHRSVGGTRAPRADSARITTACRRRVLSERASTA